MLPPESVTRAARRWLDLLKRSTAAQAWTLLRTGADYADLPFTAYLQALGWLDDMDLLVPVGATSQLDPALARLPPAQSDQLLYARGLALDTPPWLADADVLITQPGELPSDAAALAEQLGLDDTQALAGIGQARGKVDTERAAEIGLGGELALCAALEAGWPGSTAHLAGLDDGWGYDIAFSPAPGEQWHLEVKTTTRRGRLAVFLSRNELDVGAADSAWRAVAVGLGPHGQIAALATVRPCLLSSRAPADTSPAARWTTTQYQLRAEDLDRGLPFITGTIPAPGADLITGLDPTQQFAWMPV